MQFEIAILDLTLKFKNLLKSVVVVIGIAERLRGTLFRCATRLDFLLFQLFAGQFRRGSLFCFIFSARLCGDSELFFQRPQLLAMFLQHVGGFKQLSQSLLIKDGFILLLGHGYVFHSHRP